MLLPKPDVLQYHLYHLLASAAEDGEETVAGTQTAIQGWIDCYEKAKLAGTIFAADASK